MVWGIKLVVMCEALRKVTGISEAPYKYLLNKKGTKKASREVSWSQRSYTNRSLVLNL